MQTERRPAQRDFGWQATVSAFQPTLRTRVSGRSCFGVPPEQL